MKVQFTSMRYRRPLWMASLFVLVALVLAACQPGQVPATGATATSMPAPTATMAPAATATQPAASDAEISVATDPKLGKILVGNNGMTLYMFTKDEANKVNCAGDCIAKWPPLRTKGNPKLGAGVDASLVGTADLPDGTKIVTYNKMPLYYWVKDTKAGDTTGQGVGSVWYVVSPDGKVVGMESSQSAATQPAAVEAEINVATDAKLGKILVGSNGMTLYMFTKDEAGKSNCNADCLAKWPPLVTKGTPKLGDGVDASLVGTADLPDGSKIVTYNKMPLYYWVKDTKAGDTTGQGVGSVWYVVSPDGKAVGMESPQSAATQPAVAEAEINVATDPKLGKILVGSNGMTLYMFTKDEAGKSNCNADCLAKWPPLVTKGSPKLGPGVDASLVGTADLPDGSKIVTYNKMPLYYWVKDTKAGDTTGQGVGSVWYVVSPDGKVIGQ
jgi:predicted lipoprotein with Yx(FWY)xxD motif